MFSLTIYLGHSPTPPPANKHTSPAHQSPNHSRQSSPHSQLPVHQRVSCSSIQTHTHSNDIHRQSPKMQRRDQIRMNLQSEQENKYKLQMIRDRPLGMSDDFLIQNSIRQIDSVTESNQGQKIQGLSQSSILTQSQVFYSTPQVSQLSPTSPSKSQNKPNLFHSNQGQQNQELHVSPTTSSERSNQELLKCSFSSSQFSAFKSFSRVNLQQTQTKTQQPKTKTIQPQELFRRRDREQIIEYKLKYEDYLLRRQPIVKQHFSSFAFTQFHTIKQHRYPVNAQKLNELETKLLRYYRKWQLLKQYNHPDKMKYQAKFIQRILKLHISDVQKLQQRLRMDLKTIKWSFSKKPTTQLTEQKVRQIQTLYANLLNHHNQNPFIIKENINQLHSLLSSLKLSQSKDYIYQRTAINVDQSIKRLNQSLRKTKKPSVSLIREVKTIQPEQQVGDTGFKAILEENALTAKLMEQSSKLQVFQVRFKKQKRLVNINPPVQDISPQVVTENTQIVFEQFGKAKLICYVDRSQLLNGKLDQYLFPAYGSLTKGTQKIYISQKDIKCIKQNKILCSQSRRLLRQLMFQLGYDLQQQIDSIRTRRDNYLEYINPIRLTRWLKYTFGLGLFNEYLSLRRWIKSIIPLINKQQIMKLCVEDQQFLMMSSNFPSVSEDYLKMKISSATKGRFLCIDQDIDVTNKILMRDRYQQIYSPFSTISSHQASRTSFYFQNYKYWPKNAQPIYILDQYGNQVYQFKLQKPIPKRPIPSQTTHNVKWKIKTNFDGSKFIQSVLDTQQIIQFQGDISLAYNAMQNKLNNKINSLKKIINQGEYIQVAYMNLDQFLPHITNNRGQFPRYSIIGTDIVMTCNNHDYYAMRRDNQFKEKLLCLIQCKCLALGYNIQLQKLIDPKYFTPNPAVNLQAMCRVAMALRIYGLTQPYLSLMRFIYYLFQTTPQTHLTQRYIKYIQQSQILSLNPDITTTQTQTSTMKKLAFKPFIQYS